MSIAVSYTHLDVYKRQPQDVDAQAGVQPRILADAKVVPLLRSDLSMAASGIAQSVAIQEGDRVEAGQTLIKLDAVSYTHLDVYKRQALYRRRGLNQPYSAFSFHPEMEGG